MIIMKKYLFVLMMGLMLVFTISSCDNRTQLEVAVEDANSELPEDLGNGMVMTHCELVGNSVIYVIECDEEMISLDALEENKADLYNGTLEGLRKEADEDVKEYYSMLKEDNIDMKYKYIGKQSRNEVMVNIPASKLP